MWFSRKRKQPMKGVDVPINYRLDGETLFIRRVVFVNFDPELLITKADDGYEIADVVIMDRETFQQLTGVPA